MDKPDDNHKAFVALGCAAVLVGLVITQTVDGGWFDVLGWISLVGGALTFHAGLVGYATK